jgi:hypothetical protein
MAAKWTRGNSTKITLEVENTVLLKQVLIDQGESGLENDGAERGVWFFVSYPMDSKIVRRSPVD